MLLGRKPIGTMAYMGGTPALLGEFTWAWGQLVAYTAHYVCAENEYVHLDRSRVSFHSWARNHLAAEMLGDWLFMLDTDHKFEPDILSRLLVRLNDHDLDVVCGVYQLKVAPHPPVLFGWHTPPGGTEGLLPLADWGDATELIEIGAAGGGCLLVRRRVFDRIRDELKEQPFDVIGQGGEDMGFFTRLRKLGIKAWADVRVENPHLIDRALTMADYKPVEGAGLVLLPDTKSKTDDRAPKPTRRKKVRLR